MMGAPIQAWSQTSCTTASLQTDDGRRKLSRSRSSPAGLGSRRGTETHIPGYKGHVPGYNMDIQESLGHSFGRATAVLDELQKGQAAVTAKLPHHGADGRPYVEASRGGPRTPIAAPFEVKRGWI